jgi:UrcA family protein
MKTLIAIFAACLASAVASAQNGVVVDYSDVNHATSDGASALYRRIVNASEEVCDRESVLGVRGPLWRSCVRAAVEQAVADVDSPLLAARHHREAPGRLYSARASTK